MNETAESFRNTMNMILLNVLIVNLLRTVPATSHDTMTSYSCEGSTLLLSCPPSTTISILLANYGRFSLSVCNDHAVHNMRTDCGDPIKTTEILSNLCEYKAECEVDVEDHKFAVTDCPNISKYLEVQYQCKNNTSRRETRFPNLEENISSLWNSQEKNLSPHDLDHALSSRDNVDDFNSDFEMNDNDEMLEKVLVSKENFEIIDQAFPRILKESGLGQLFISNKVTKPKKVIPSDANNGSMTSREEHLLIKSYTGISDEAVITVSIAVIFLIICIAVVCSKKVF